MRKCASLFVVAPIERILTDTMVHAKLAEGGSRKAVVCTKVDVSIKIGFLQLMGADSSEHEP